MLHAAQQAAEGTLDLKKLASLPDEALFARLMELDGVGKKVANCVCLFGYGRVGRVPVDVWIERLLRGEFAGQDIKTQTRQSLTNISNILAAAGASMADVVKTTVLLNDIADFAAMNEVYAEFFTEP